MDAERLERLMVQVLSEVQDFRQTVADQFHELGTRMDRLETRMDRLDAKIDHVHEELSARIDHVAHDVKLTQLAVLEVADEVKRINVRLDNHEARLIALEGAAQ
ncbi:MAG: hypothetical protein FWD69_04965 [Polyangiaceae bacterium]|nr:hypothetical protein [Polyangiaceae bacterium]